MKKSIMLLTSALLFSTCLAVSSTAFAAGEGAKPGSPALYDTKAVITFAESDEVIDPVDPIDPSIPVTPINPIDPNTNVPEGTKGPLSLDYASAFNFQDQKISSKDKTYYAKLQEVIKTDGGAKSTKPLYIQLTDNTGTANGWKLQVRQNGQFKTSDSDKKELEGAVITLKNGQKESDSISTAPSEVKTTIELSATGGTHDVMSAAKGEGTGTWIYRMGNMSNMDEGVSLFVPGISTKLKDKEYATSLTWTLSMLP